MRARRFTVWVNGIPRDVPRYAFTFRYLCSLLKVPEGHAVGFYGVGGWELISETEWCRPWEFEDRQQYMTGPRRGPIGGLNLTQRLKRIEDAELEPWQTNPDAWKEGDE